MQRNLAVGACSATIFLALWSGTDIASANGNLIFDNQSAVEIDCSVTNSANPVKIPSGQSVPWAYSGGNAAQCSAAGGAALNIRGLAITSDGPDQTLYFNGQQTRVLNVALYPYLPALPANGAPNFAALANYVESTFQASNPQVLVNAVMNQNVDIYNFTGLPTLLTSQTTGYDVMELDMLYLGFLAQNNLINSQNASLPDAYPVALNAASYNGQLYGIPSWLCMDFLYAVAPGAQNATSVASLLTYLNTGQQGQTSLVGNFDGSWRLPSMYVNGYIQQYGYSAANIQNALSTPPDATVMQNLVQIVNACGANGGNLCIDGTYHGAANGATEKAFANGNAFTDVGFSEQDFYVNFYKGSPGTYAVPMPWGAQIQPLLFADSFVTSAANCAPNSACTSDATNFIAFMTSQAMRNYIVQSQDQGSGAPFRTLLVPYRSFYQQPWVQAIPIYANYQAVLAGAQPFPNTWTADQQTSVGWAVCQDFQKVFTNYKCKTGP